MGVDSGLPDFRGPQGLWKAYPALKRNVSLPAMSTPHWFEDDPHFAWAFFGHRYLLYSKTKPHMGFEILQKWCRNKSYFVYTSNVDGQFQTAGFDENRIVECHGTIHLCQCTQTQRHGAAAQPLFKTADVMDGVTVDLDTFQASGVPKCPLCGSTARPNILMFNDWQWLEERTTEQEDRFDRWRQDVHSGSMVVVEVGAGTAVPTIRSLGNRLAAHNCPLVRINPDESEGPRLESCVGIPLPALQALTELDALIQAE
eukprot:Platyproteum_vivax@DN6773_c0_g1_i4.p1